MKHLGPVVSRHGLDRHGIAEGGPVYWNLPVAPLVERALRRGEGRLVRGGALLTDTGAHTGRSPDDRFIVNGPALEDEVDWGEVNRPLSKARFDGLRAKVEGHLRGRELFVQDLHAGADPRHRLKVRVVSEKAWHALFARNMFRLPARRELEGFEPDVTVLHAPDLEADPQRDGTHSGTFVVLGIEQRLVLIGGTHYAGEIKKSIFSLLNHHLPGEGVLPMHCSANAGEAGDVAIFFGLSGTGKTTLSADASRRLIGDDEHGWGESGIFNFEGGCYAKVIGLDPEAEPEIHAASLRFGAILENVVADPLTGEPDFDDKSRTENTRSSYPLDFIANADPDGTGGHPANIVMLTADAFGVLPPIALLSPEEAMYHFLSGYTAKLAGTERGATEPQATFSACFGAPFMPRHPSVYADMLRARIRRHDARCWLLNTGWTGGVYGSGRRIALRDTRAMLRAALDGRLAAAPTRKEPHFGLTVPTRCPGVESGLLDPAASWGDERAYRAKARELAGRFEENFRRFAPHVGDEVASAGIHATA